MMQWALVSALIILVIMNVLTSLTSSRTIRDMLKHLDKARSAHHEQLEGLVDRTLARSYEEYRTWKSTEIAWDDDLNSPGFKMPPLEDFAASRPFDSAALVIPEGEEDEDRAG